MKVELFGLSLPEVKPGDNLARMLVESCEEEANGIQDGDILVVTSKIISKAYGLLIKIEEEKPGAKALEIAGKTGMNPKMVQAILDNSEEILLAIPFLRLVEKGLINLEHIARDKERAYQVVREIPCLLIVKRGDHIYSDAGLDFSNHPKGIVSIPPENPDKYAREIRERIKEITGREVAVIISDTEVTPFIGSLDLARGSSGIEVVSRRFGDPDRYGKPKFGGIDNIVDELACASALLMGQTSEGIPAVLIRGLKYVRSEEGVSTYSLSPDRIKAIIKEIIKETIKIVGARRILRFMLSMII